MLAISIYKVNTIVGKKANYTCGVARVCCAYMYVYRYKYTAIYNLALNVHMWCFFFAICNMPMRQRGKIVFSNPSICFFFNICRIFLSKNKRCQLMYVELIWGLRLCIIIKFSIQIYIYIAIDPAPCHVAQVSQLVYIFICIIILEKLTLITREEMKTIREKILTHYSNTLHDMLIC